MRQLGTGVMGDIQAAGVKAALLMLLPRLPERHRMKTAFTVRL